MYISEKEVKAQYEQAKALYAKFGVDTDAAIEKLFNTEISLHCWQGDDIDGYENVQVASQNVVTGNHFGKARTVKELRDDIALALSFSPVKHKVNLHAIYAEDGSSVARDKMTYKSFEPWVEWAKEKGVGLDFNATMFAHEMMKHDMSLSSPDEEVRTYWVNHCKASRQIAYEMGKALGKTVVCNIWIPDGMKDNPANKAFYRELLKKSLDEIFSVKYDKKYLVDAVEGKLFGIGTESYVVGSYDFYLAYAVQNDIGICLDLGHYHPTEKVSDKLSAVAPFVSDVLLHVSRGVRWDSDHAVILDDELQALFNEIKRGNYFDKVHIGLDYFDASINRIVAWTVGLRSSGKALLNALLEPTEIIDKAEKNWDFSARLAYSEEFKTLPSEAVWNMACLKAGVPVGADWIEIAEKYEKDVLAKRN